MSNRLAHETSPETFSQHVFKGTPVLVGGGHELNLTRASPRRSAKASTCGRRQVGQVAESGWTLGPLSNRLRLPR